MKNGAKVVIIIAVLVTISSLGCAVCRLLSRSPAQAQAVPPPHTNTPKPTFTVTPTDTPLPPPTNTPIPTDTPPSTEPPAAEPPPAETPTAGERTVHVVQSGENLSVIAAKYGVTVEAIMGANGLSNRSFIRTGQELIIPAPGENVPPPPTPEPVQEPAPAEQPPPAEEQPPPAEEQPPPAEEQPPPAEEQPPPAEEQPPPAEQEQHQFTAEIVQWWPNCGFMGVAKSMIKEANTGEPVNGLRVKIWNDAGLEFFSHVSGIGMDYGPGQYDFALGNRPMNVVFHMTVWDWKTGADEYTRVDSEVIDLHFDMSDCQPEGSGHQAVQVDWYRHW
jgi:LysM repeat protein